MVKGDLGGRSKKPHFRLVHFSLHFRLVFLVLQGDLVFSREYLARAHKLQVRAVFPLVASWEARASLPTFLFLPVKYVGCYFSVFQTRINLGISGPAAARVLSNISAMLGAKAGQADLHIVLLLIACGWGWAARSSRCWHSPIPHCCFS